MEPSPLTPLPAQPAGTPWPTQAWPESTLPPDHPVHGVIEQGYAPDALDSIGDHQALVIVHRGRLVFERYGEGFGPEVTTRSWSMAKSITQALVGFAVSDGKLDIHAPAAVAQWREPGDPRAAITLDHLLRMASGLQWAEVYLPDQPSDVIAMLFGEGQDDTARFAASFPLAQAPDTHFCYSSGTTNIVSRLVADAIGANGEAFHAFMRERLFDPLGTTSADPRFDAAGTFIGSSYCFCTPRDFAKFGLLYLRGGAWDGGRLLPPEWVDYARTRRAPQPGPEEIDGPYGAHWWLDIAGPGSFSANGYEGQYIVCCPDRDLIIVRNGVTPGPKLAIKGWLREIAETFPQL
jgi:CubicO group peptidase (beta-lactamase class C family)